MFTMFVASSFSQVSIAVGLAGFACVLLLVLFVLINKYGRRSKFGMKGKTLTLAHGQTHIFIYLFTFTSLHHRVDLFSPLISTELLFYCNRFTSFSCFTESHSSLILLPRVIFFFFYPFPHMWCTRSSPAKGHAVAIIHTNAFIQTGQINTTGQSACKRGLCTERTPRTFTVTAM